MRWSTLVFVFALLGSFCLAGEPDLDTVMKGYLKALGGEKKVHKIITLKKPASISTTAWNTHSPFCTRPTGCAWI